MTNKRLTNKIITWNEKYFYKANNRTGWPFGRPAPLFVFIDSYRPSRRELICL